MQAFSELSLRALLAVIWCWGLKDFFQTAQILRRYQAGASLSGAWDFVAAVMTTLINPYMGMINDGLTHFLNGMGGASRIVLGMVLGAMMSIDMGGPFNKAAYVFGYCPAGRGEF